MATWQWQKQMCDLLKKILEEEKIKWIPNVVGEVLWPRNSNTELRFFDLIIVKDDGDYCVVALSLRGSVIPNLEDRLRMMLRIAKSAPETTLEVFV